MITTSGNLGLYWPMAHTPRLHLEIFMQPGCSWQMDLLCMVGAGNGASVWATNQIGHIWGGPMVTTILTTGSFHTIALAACSVLWQNIKERG